MSDLNTIPKVPILTKEEQEKITYWINWFLRETGYTELDCFLKKRDKKEIPEDVNKIFWGIFNLILKDRTDYIVHDCEDDKSRKFCWSDEEYVSYVYLWFKSLSGRRNESVGLDCVSINGSKYDFETKTQHLYFKESIN